MAEKFKSKQEIKSLASAIKERRLSLGLTLKDLEKEQHIHCGQLSRFEAGQFKTNSPNLQRLCRFLQIFQSPQDSKALGTRLEQFAALSPQHLAAAEDLLTALERLR
jgi:transcriptional regulator with XRE-family HTH domain